VQADAPVAPQVVNVTAPASDSFLAKLVAKVQTVATSVAMNEITNPATAGARLVLDHVLTAVEEAAVKTVVGVSAIPVSVEKALLGALKHPTYARVIRPRVVLGLGATLAGGVVSYIAEWYTEDYLYPETKTDVANGLCAANPDSPLCR
jgi:hypothetical protein